MKTHIVRLSIVLTSLLISGIGYCQIDQATATMSQQRKHSLGASIGINDFHIKDEYLSPIVFSGLTFSSRISYQLRLAKTRHAVDVLFSVGSIDSDIQPRNVKQYVGYFSYSFTRELDRRQIAGHPLRLSLGSGLSTFASNTDFIAEDKAWNYKFTDESWYWYHSVNLRLRGDYQLAERRNLSLQLTSPLARLVTRPENGHFFNSKNAEIIDSFWNAATAGEAEFLWENFVLLSEIEYRQSLGNRLDMRATYFFEYASSDTPLSMAMYMNHFLIGLDWLF